jgi:hypothetical protein
MYKKEDLKFKFTKILQIFMSKSRIMSWIRIRHDLHSQHFLNQKSYI